MNEYQRALDFFRSNACGDEDKCDDCDINYSCDFQINIEKHYKTLQELVEKQDSKKPIKRYYTTKHGNNGKMKRVDILCPFCKSYFVNGVRKSVGLFASREKNFIDDVKQTKYCMFCGNRIDWGD